MPQPFVPLPPVPDRLARARALGRLGSTATAFLAIVALLASITSTAAATTLPTGYAEENIDGNWLGAVGIQFDDNGRSFVWTRDGYVWIVESGVRGPQPFLDLREEVGGWRDFGLLGFTLHPNFNSNGYFYLQYVVDRHHLLHFGTGSYDAGTDEYFAPTQGRITRFRALMKTGSSDYSDAEITDYTTRTVLAGDAPGTGCPILYESHGTGAIIFGTDGTLLAACGDGASYSTQDNGSVGHTYYAQAITDGIMRPDENVGAFRAQMVTSYSGMIIRIDPDTGDGVPSNPQYDGAAPRSAKSRMWAQGLRNPYRMVKRPGTGSHDAADGDPGAVFVGDVGWGTWEDIHVSKSPGQNFGWPIYEGIEQHSGYAGVSVPNPAAPNPLFGVGGCTQEFFTFQDVLINETQAPSPSWPNPCDAGEEIPAEFAEMHARPEIDYRHGSGPSRWSTFDLGGNPVHYDIGSTPPAGITPVPGPQFGGNAATAGVFYEGTDFEGTYQGVYFHGDYGAKWIRGFRFDANHEPTEVMNFATGAGGVVFLATHPVDGALYYSSYSSPSDADFRKVSFIGSGNFPPTAIASVVGDNFGPEPLQIDFVGDQSIDPDQLPLDYLWSFSGLGSSTQANPTFTFDPGDGQPTLYTVTLTVTDDGQGNGDESDVDTVFVSVNNSPPTVNITSPADGTFYSITQAESYDLTADISDLEHSGGELACGWVTTLHHNNHTHTGQIDPSCTTTTIISPAGCDGNTYFWSVALTVSDAAGLFTTETHYLYPDCPNLPPVAVGDTASVYQGYSVDVDVLANDTDDKAALDPTSVTIVDSPLYGTIDSIDPLTGFVTYTHDGSTNLADSFTYTVDDTEPATSNIATVTLTATNDPPVVSISAPLDESAFSVGQNISLAASAIDTEDGTPPGVDWEIQRIHDGSLIPAVYTYSGSSPPDFAVPDVGAPGDHISYLVNVTVTDSVGAAASDQVHILPLSPPPNNAPTAGFLPDATIGSPPFLVNFDASSSSDLDGDYLLYDWDFGDGAAGTGQLAAHTFTSQGTHDVSLTVTDAVGAEDTAVLQIQVLDPGLLGEYFDNMTLNGAPALARTDPVIDFGWGSGSPDPSIGNDGFSARWTGQVEPQFTESYTFYTETDDGVRLWIDGQLVIDQWIDQSPTEWPSTPVALVAGQKIDIVMEYFENGGGAVARLRWSSPSQSKQIIPAGSLTGPVPPNQAPLAANDMGVVVRSYSVVIDVLGNDFDDNGAIDPSTVIEVSAPSNGTTSVDVVSGEITYFHNGSPGTNDSFGYTVEDSEGLVSNPGSVFITIFDAPGVTLDTPADGANVVGDTLNLTYTITGEASLWNHIHFQLDSDPHISDFTPDGTFSFLNVPVGPHTITTWLVMSDHQALPYPESLDSIGVTMIAGEACGNGVVEGSEECDDDNLVDGDCCSSTCTNEPAASACSDGDACTLADSCDGAGLCLSGAPLVCDDTFYCNGLETCDSIVGCEAGTPPVVSDGVACTNDSCDEALDIVVNTPNDALCDDSLYCNGAETCDDQLGCQAGAPPIVDDGVACTDDGCDEVGDVVVNLPNDAGCSDGLFCNGGEICDAVTGCGTGSPPVVDDGVACTADTCDETDDVIVNDPVDLACDDGDVCTADSCDAVSGCANDVIPGCEVAVPAGSPWSHGGLILLLMAVSSLSLGVLRRQSA